MTELDGTLSATASLVGSIPWWPAVAAFGVWLERAHIGGLLDRIRKLKVGGQEAELDPAVRKFERGVDAEVVRQDVERQLLPADPPPPTMTPQKIGDEEANVIAMFSQDPRLGILALSSLIERETRELAAQLGIDASRTLPWPSLISLLTQRGSLGASMPSTAQLFRTIRNQIAHGQEEPSKQDLAVVLDSGLTLLRVLRSVPHESYTVQRLVPIYSDQAGAHEMQGVQGVVLRVSSPGGTTVEERIYPTMRPLKVGARVSWAWNPQQVFGEAWYRKPPGRKLQKAWDWSSEFVGVPLDEAGGGTN